MCRTVKPWKVLITLHCSSSWVIREYGTALQLEKRCLTEVVLYIASGGRKITNVADSIKLYTISLTVDVKPVELMLTVLIHYQAMPYDNAACLMFTSYVGWPPTITRPDSVGRKCDWVKVTLSVYPRGEGVNTLRYFYWLSDLRVW